MRIAAMLAGNPHDLLRHPVSHPLPLCRCVTPSFSRATMR